MSRVPRRLVPNRWHPERLASPRSSVFLGSVRSLSEAGHLAASLIPRVRQDSEAVDVDCRQLVGRCLKDCPVVMDLHELSPVDRRAAGGRDGRRFERFAEVCQGLILWSGVFSGRRRS